MKDTGRGIRLKGAPLSLLFSFSFSSVFLSTSPGARPALLLFPFFLFLLLLLHVLPPITVVMGPLSPPRSLQHQTFPCGNVHMEKKREKKKREKKKGK